MADVPSTLTPTEIAITLIKIAVAKHNTRWDKTFFKAALAGVMLSFGCLFDIVIISGSTCITGSTPCLIKLLGGFVFPVGLVIIVLQLEGFELLTSNFMICPMAAIKGAIPWWGVPVNWIIVTFGNLVGSLFLAAILSKYDGLTTEQPCLGYIQKLVIAKAINPAWYQIFLRGIGCNLLISVAVWQSVGAKETISKILATWFPIWAFIMCGLDHVVSNMFSLPLGIMLHADLTTAEYIRKSLIASYLGNIFGALLVGLPAIYFYLDDWEAGGLRNAEEAHADKISHTSSQDKVRGCAHAWFIPFPYRR